MSNAYKVIEKISDYIDKYHLKTSQLSNNDIITFIEGQWAQADDEKYKIHYSQTVIGRMMNEYIRLLDFENLMRWINMDKRIQLPYTNPDYIKNYYYGDCCLRCGNEEKALYFFNLSITENPDYFHTRRGISIEQFKEKLANPKAFEENADDNDEPEEIYIELAYWQKFFKEDNDICVNFMNDEHEYIYDLTEKESKILEHLEKKQKDILEILLTALLEKYPKLQELYDYPEDKKVDFMPDVSAIEGFANLLSPLNIYALENKDKTYRLGYLFSCSWDNEHALGIMTNNNEVLNIGGADVAFG